MECPPLHGAGGSLAHYEALHIWIRGKGPAGVGAGDVVHYDTWTKLIKPDGSYGGKPIGDDDVIELQRGGTGFAAHDQDALQVWPCYIPTPSTFAPLRTPIWKFFWSLVPNYTHPLRTQSNVLLLYVPLRLCILRMVGSCTTAILLLCTVSPLSARWRNL